MDVTHSSQGFSPPIAITLDVDGRRYAVREAGPDFVVLADSTAERVGPADATLTVTVGGQPVTRHVHLPEGIRPNSPDQPLVRTLHTVGEARPR
jgi:hypothetical protein